LLAGSAGRNPGVFFARFCRVFPKKIVPALWVPKGETPVLVYAFNWKELSLCAALGYRWDGKRCRLWFQARPGTCNDERLITFLCNLKKHLHGQKAPLIWDGLSPSAHTGAFRQFCTPGEGHEKGGVEGEGGQFRRNYLVPMPKVSNLEELNRLLESEADQEQARHGAYGVYKG
jgi:hypothetical protein